MDSIHPGRGDRQRPRAAARSREPLGGSSYEYEQEFSRPTGRRLFLDAVRRHYPRVLEALAAKPYDVYQQLAQHVDSGWPRHVAATPGDIDAAGPEFGPLRESVRAWSLDWCLDADWCRHCALRTLGDWADQDAFLRGQDTATARMMAALAETEGQDPREHLAALRAWCARRPRQWAHEGIAYRRPFLDEEFAVHVAGQDEDVPVYGVFAFTPEGYGARSPSPSRSGTRSIAARPTRRSARPWISSKAPSRSILRARGEWHGRSASRPRCCMLYCGG